MSQRASGNLGVEDGDRSRSRRKASVDALLAELAAVLVRRAPAALDRYGMVRGNLLHTSDPGGR
jgi:hypothetical protein